MTNSSLLSALIGSFDRSVRWKQKTSEFLCFSRNRQKKKIESSNSLNLIYYILSITSNSDILLIILNLCSLSCFTPVATLEVPYLLNTL